MAKTKKQQHPQSGAIQSPVISESSNGLASFFSNTGMQSVLFFLLAFLLYANTLTHGFVLDDYMVIKKNSFTQQGLSGIPGILSKDSFWGFFDAMKEDPKQLLVTGGRYRPLSLLIFALIWQFFGENTFIFHAVTVLFYACTGVLLYRLLILMLEQRFGDDYARLFAWIATLLFICHPVHTEVAANIKGCDEILSLLGSLGALYCALMAYDTGKRNWWIASAAIFFLACMSKENAATFLFIVPMAFWCFRGEQTAATSRIQIMLGLLGAFAMFFVLRGQALDWSFSNEAPYEPMNNPFIKIVGDHWEPFSPTEKLATVFYTLGKYISLLLFPVQLTHDYYPRQIGILTFSNMGAMASLVLYFALGIYGLMAFRKRSIAGFAILFYLITLSIVSNLVFSVGTLMNERFVYMPSVGFCMLAALGLLFLKEKMGNSLSISLGLTLLISALFAYKTLVRNPDWSSNERLFLTDVKISTNSAKAHDDAGGVLFNEASASKDAAAKSKLLDEAVAHFDFALGIHPKYRHALMHRAAAYHLQEKYDKSVPEYRRILQLFPGDKKVMDALGLTLRDYGKYQGEKMNNLAEASKALTEAWNLNPSDAKAAWLIGVSFAKQSRFAEAVEWFSKAVEMKPESASYNYDLGTAYFRSGNSAKGQEYYDKAKKIDPKIGEKRGEK